MTQLTGELREIIGFLNFYNFEKSTKIPLINFRHLFLGENDGIIGKITGKSTK